MNPEYDATDAQSLLKFALRLSGRTLRDFMTEEEQTQLIENPQNKGDLGTIVEKYYFHWDAGAKPGPDFPDAGVELKTSAVIPHRKNRYSAKERLKLMSINYMKLPAETWSNNSLMRKCETILLLFTLYERDLSLLDRRFIINPRLWNFPEKDLNVIRSDWEVINNKVRAGKAHELSGSDTLYLEACTSGASGQTSEQPYSELRAKKRSFALKASYINVAVIASAEYAEDMESVLGDEDNPSDFGEIVLARLKRFYGMEVEEIVAKTGGQLSKSKHHLARLGYRMLDIKSNRAEEFEKAGIEVKSINLRVNGTPEQDMSFPAFSYMDIVDEDWNDSVFRQRLDKKFLFIIFQKKPDGTRIFKKAMFWQMPPADLQEAQRVWEETKRRIQNGHADKLPLKPFSLVAHVRPHGRDSKPANRKETPHNGKLPAMCFWLNVLYIKKHIS